MKTKIFPYVGMKFPPTYLEKIFIFEKSFTIIFKIFFNYCDENDNGFIDAEELRVFMIKNLHNLEDKKIAKTLIKDFYYELCPN